jgi:hypothetical protein
MMIMRVIVIMEAEPTPPIRISPPGIIIPPGLIIRIGEEIGKGLGVGKIIVFLPEVDLFARNHRIAVIHFSKKLQLFPQDFTRYGNPPSFPIELRV